MVGARLRQMSGGWSEALFRRLVLAVAVLGLVVSGACREEAEPLPYPFSQLFPDCEDFDLVLDFESHGGDSGDFRVEPREGEQPVFVHAERMCKSSEKVEVGGQSLETRILWMTLLGFRSESDAVAHMRSVREFAEGPTAEERHYDLQGAQEYVACSSVETTVHQVGTQVDWRVGRYVVETWGASRDELDYYEYARSGSEPIGAWIAARQMLERWPQVTGALP